MAAIAASGSHELEVGELQATLRLRRGQFAQAREAFAALAKQARDPAAAARLGAIADVLNDNDDGLYVLSEPYPPAAALLGQAQRLLALPAGPASLAEPMVMEAALHNKAKQFLQAGSKFMDDARLAEPADGEQAKRLYTQAEREFDRADALVADVSRSYKVEIVRRRIALIRAGTDAQAAKFDAEMASLGKEEMAPPAYANKVARMSRYLSGIRSDLDAILKLAGPYSRDLVLEIKWAELDKQRIGAMLETLRQELAEARP